MRWSSGSAGGSGRCLTRGPQAPPRIGRQRGQHGAGRLIGLGQRRRRVRGGHEPLQQVDVARRVEVREQLLAQAFDVHLEQVQDAERRAQVVGGQRFRPLAQPFEQHLLVAHRAQAQRDPAQL